MSHMQQTSSSPGRSIQGMPDASEYQPNEMAGIDRHVTAEPTPKMESRRGWRRRRILRGKS